VIELAHPGSAGLRLQIDPDTPDVRGEVVTWLQQNRILHVVAAAPHFEHPTPASGLRTLTQIFDWPATELRALAFLLWEAGAVTLEEAAWLAGYVADDAPMTPISPEG
jgi:hypothetical protein